MSLKMCECWAEGDIDIGCSPKSGNGCCCSINSGFHMMRPLRLCFRCRPHPGFESLRLYLVAAKIEPAELL
jgi:hypothetical protein